MRKHLRLSILALALATVSAACGLRTPVRPPEDTAPVIPGAVQAIRTSDEPGVVLVRWKRAERSADGMRLDDLVAFIVERRRGGEENWQRITTVNIVDQEKIRRREDFSYRDSEAGVDPASYRVIAVTEEGQEGEPTTPAVAVMAPPAPSATSDGTNADDTSDAAAPAGGSDKTADPVTRE